MCILGISRYDLSVVCTAQCRIVVFIEVKRSVMELEILEFGRVSRNVTLLILSCGTDIVVIVSGTIVWMLRAKM
jgi:hypothetical protein